MTERFWDQVSRVDDAGCWLWVGVKCPDGYGRVRIDGAPALAHRVAYELTRGPIPAGLQIDHLCRTPLCCNPAHMEAVTQRENVLRGIGPTAINAAKTHCKFGHPLSGDNLMLRDDGRQCRTCVRRRARERTRRYRDRKKAAA